MPLPVALISMPFGMLRSPSLGLSLLKAGLSRRGIGSKVHYFTLDYARTLGEDLYLDLTTRNPFPADLVGEWIFAPALGREGDPEAYERLVLEGGHRAHRKEAGALESGWQATLAGAKAQRALTPDLLEGWVDRILADAPRVVGFSTVFEQTAASLAAARLIKERSPDTLVVLGGANAEGPMGEALFETHAFLDAVFSGECDHRFPEAMAAFLETGRIPKAPGLQLRPWLEGPPAAGDLDVKDMDSLPVPDFSDFFEQLAASGLEMPGRPAILFETSRGCWWGAKQHCTFCGLNGETMAYRSKSADRALEEYRELQRRHPGCEVLVVDNILDMSYFKTFLPALAAEGNPSDIFYEVKANLTKDQLRILKAARVSYIQPGIESLSDGVLKLMKKGVRGLQNLQLLKWCAELGVDPVWNFLYGFPGEDPAEYTRMAELLPLLGHLKPPFICVKIRLDRFSPNFTGAEAAGFTEVHAYPAYGLVFGLSPELADRVAYYFDCAYADGRDPDAYAAPLREAVEAWKRGGGRESLVALDKGDHLLVFDTRAVALQPLALLEGPERAAILACDGATTFDRVLAAVRLSLPETTPAQLEAALASLRDRRLLVSEGGLHLALPIPAMPSPQLQEAAS
ncbi:MAG TPA: RiPP maturation radical SAM C-methyltransferase [Holophagaceae bacterium]|nr:RiPP maturation radical SAM C-methyltransferase [Holophagaceae bacterium]